MVVDSTKASKLTYTILRRLYAHPVPSIRNGPRLRGLGKATKLQPGHDYALQRLLLQAHKVRLDRAIDYCEVIPHGPPAVGEAAQSRGTHGRVGNEGKLGQRVVGSRRGQAAVGGIESGAAGGDVKGGADGGQDARCGVRGARDSEAAPKGGLELGVRGCQALLVADLVLRDAVARSANLGVDGFVGSDAELPPDVGEGDDFGLFGSP
ncbi:hypothetical protein MCOR02_003991 [Pyricularia oryzae]|nr:hypothetical protein MCOR02_003991 [Pyricularia oryzae]